MNVGYINPRVVVDTMITEKLRSRFCKDMNINIKFCKDRDLFLDRLMLCSDEIQMAYVTFIEEVTALGGEQAFFEAYNQIKDAAINAIKSTPTYEEFIGCNINEKFPLLTLNYPNNGIYKETNAGKKFLSIDLKKGNYTAMKFFDKSLVGNTKTYEDFISQFTDMSHIINSKYIRQVIFGNCNPKRQTHIEKYLMCRIFNNIKSDIDANNITVAAFTDDEIVLDISNVDEDIVDVIKIKVSDICANLNINTHIKDFNLEKIKDIYLLKDDDGAVIDTKCVNYITFPFIQRYLRNEQPKQSDYIFEFEGMKAKLLENPLGDEITYSNLDKFNEEEMEL